MISESQFPTEAAARGLNIPLRVDDIRELRTSPNDRCGVVLAFDNALPHRDSDDDVRRALSALRESLSPEGKLLISLCDHGPLIEQRPAVTPPTMFLDDGRRRIVHQVRDWKDERRYIVDLYITREMPNGEWGVVDETEEHWAGVMYVNVDTMFLACRHATPAMIRTARGGSIVNISSISALRPRGLTADNVPKGAVIALTKSMAVDHGPQGIRVNCVFPGPV
jgi:NAD(P)-dependent dehydrogenase (short-subunit alcohol dehydrogenase family)